jgi:exopolyphosphatase/guanosine-5'-triphosphate,3'-diphosphate pyrophosphatase
MIRVAVVDVGSNAIRLVWQAVDSLGQVRDEGYHRYGLRLGTDAFSLGKLRRQTTQDLVSVFGEIASLIQTHQIDSYRAVATAAMRAATNTPSVLKRIKRETGIDLKVIDGETESELSRQALVQAAGGVSGRTLLIDLGGGSLELERADGLYRMSTSLGTVRLMERYPELGAPMGRHTLLKMLDQVLVDLRDEVGRRGPVHAAVGSGGNLDALSRICPGGHGPIPMVDLERLPVKLVSIAAMSVEERMNILGLRADRADIIVPAGLVVAALHRMFGVQSLMVPGSGMREALLNLQTATVENVVSRARALGARKGFRKLAQSEKAVRYVFEKLAPMHKLHGAGLGVLFQAQAMTLTKEQGLCVGEAASFSQHAVEAILASSQAGFERAVETYSLQEQSTMKTMRGMHQLANRLAGAPVTHWPQMYIDQGALVLRVPGESALMRRQFTGAAKSMGLGLLFSHGE